MSSDRDPEVELVEAPADDLEDASEPPVVARLVVEIRSDGSRTIARGAIEDTELGQRTVVEARGTTPTQLAWSLAKTIAAAPVLARQLGRAMRPKRRRSLVRRVARRFLNRSGR